MVALLGAAACTRRASSARRTAAVADVASPGAKWKPSTFCGEWVARGRGQGGVSAAAAAAAARRQPLQCVAANDGGISTLDAHGETVPCVAGHSATRRSERHAASQHRNGDVVATARRRDCSHPAHHDSRRRNSPARPPRPRPRPACRSPSTQGTPGPASRSTMARRTRPRSRTHAQGARPAMGDGGRASAERAERGV